MEIYDPVQRHGAKNLIQLNATYCAGTNVSLSINVNPEPGHHCYGSAKNGAAPNIGEYPRMHLMPSGLVLICGGQAQVRSFDPATGRWAQLT